MNLKLYYPLRPFYINQRFAENKPCVRHFGEYNQQVIDSNPDGTCPVEASKLYPHFMMRGHNGTDLKAGQQNVYAATEGIVIEKQMVPARGLGLGILTTSQYDFGTYGTHFIKLRYWHLKSMYCEVGDKIEVGQVIGISDNTGFSSANHLHFEGQLYDKDAGGHPKLFLPSDAIAGAIDIEPYFNGQYADIYPQLQSKLTALIPLLYKLIEYLKRSN